jgi:hypothetical protein
MLGRCRVVAVMALVSVVSVPLLSSPAAAQRAFPSEGGAGPVPPAVYSRDAEGRVAVRAVRIAEPLVIDGRLDEEVYRTSPHLGSFIQQDPVDGDAPTEGTDVWIFFDDRNLYISAQCWDSQPDRIVGNELRRDHNGIFQNDNVTITLDTFHDLRSGFFFQTNPVGGLRDQEITDERSANVDWNTVWDVKVRRSDRGWAAEFVIPFKSLRYRGGGAQTWGINIRRIVRSKNEVSFLSPVPKAFGTQGVFKFSSAATLAGLELPGGRPPLELKPYGITGLTDTRAGQAIARDGHGDAGFDFKYGLTKGLTTDFTYNTDFAQVEADEQQINLTRFSLFFPEKRDFFLEGQGTFQFGSTRSPNITGLAPNQMPVLFFSRRIGLSEGRQVPIVAGGRMTGRAGKYSVGALQIRSGEEPSARAATTDFSVVRVRRDVLRRSTVGVIATNRSPSVVGKGSNQAFGADAMLALYDNILINSYYAESRTPGERRDQSSYMGQFAYSGDRYGVNAEHLYVGDGFNPEAGFLRRDSFRRTYGQGRFSPRPKNQRLVRRYFYEASLDYVTDPHNVLESREAGAAFRIDVSNGDGFDAEFANSYELLRSPFAIVSGVTIAPGAYGFQELRTKYTLGPQRPITGTFSLSRGSFYDGSKTEAGYDGRFEINERLAVEPRISVNQVRLSAGDFTTKLVSARTTYTFSPHMAVSALLQYASTNLTLSSNVRFRWEYRPGSDLFVVYSDGRDTQTRPGIPSLQSRSVALKLTRLFRF